MPRGWEVWGQGMEEITEATGGDDSVCAALLCGPTVWSELVLEHRLKPVGNGLETVAAIKFLFCCCWEKFEGYV